MSLAGWLYCFTKSSTRTKRYSCLSTSECGCRCKCLRRGLLGICQSITYVKMRLASKTADKVFDGANLLHFSVQNSALNLVRLVIRHGVQINHADKVLCWSDLMYCIIFLYPLWSMSFKLTMDKVLLFLVWMDSSSCCCADRKK
mgnify:CR=1 FL=1